MTPIFKSKNYTPRDTINNMQKEGKDWKHGFFFFNFTIEVEYHAAVKINQMSHVATLVNLKNPLYLFVYLNYFIIFFLTQ